MAFKRFDQDPTLRGAQWNWAAFAAAPVWYLVKGMWLKAIVLGLVSWFASAGLYVPDSEVVALVPLGLVAAYAAVHGTYDLYMWRRFSKQTW